MNISKTKRNNTVELLRVLSMSMVLVLHALLKTGALDYLSGAHYWIYWGLEAACYCAVNIFILICGYFQIHTSFKLRNVIRITIVSVWLYSVVFGCMQIIVGKQPLQITELITVFLPLTTKRFWFVNAYTILYLISPFLNKVLHALNRWQHLALNVILVLVFCVRNTCFPVGWVQSNDGGMGLIWFVTLYCVAAWLRLYEIPRIKAWMGFVAYLLATAAMVVGKKLLLALGLGIYATKIYHYASVFVLTQSVGLFVTFIKSKPIENGVGSIIDIAGKHSYSVYIIHFAMWNVLFTNILHLDKYISHPVLGLLAVLGTAVLIYAFCVFVDIAKQYVDKKIAAWFLATRLGKKYFRITETYDNLVNK